MNTTVVEALLALWFSEPARARWFNATPEFDELLRGRFGESAEAALEGRLTGWRETPQGALALVLLLDQVPRNIYRGAPGAYAGGPAALEVVEYALSRGFDAQLDDDRKAFLYMPLMHSEDLTHQERCVELFAATGLERSQAAARQHCDIVRRFGRFPHRNAVLGRTSTAAELDYLARDDAFRA